MSAIMKAAIGGAGLRGHGRRLGKRKGREGRR